MVCGIFAIEKFIYGCVWINWILNNTISVYEKDLMAGVVLSFTESMIGCFSLY
jgi:hypothetical protein